MENVQLKKKEFRFICCRSSNQETTATGFEPPCHPPARCEPRHTEGQQARLPSISLRRAGSRVPFHYLWQNSVLLSWE